MDISEEILALTLAILRLLPNYQKYRIGDYEVELKWSADRKSVEVFYKFNDIVIYGVKAAVFEHEDRPKLSMEMVPVFKSSGLHQRHTVDTLYLLLPSIARKNFQNDRELDDTKEVITRNW